MGRLFVAGIGPGNPENMTFACRAALERADVVAGYTAYAALVRPLFPDKEFIETPMTREAERCRAALLAAREGKTVALVCGGDAGVYGLAGLALELLPEYPGVEIEIIPGVTAALSGAALLGAPLGHDFAAVSLSDLLTPWEVIEIRLHCAAEADFCLALYNPSSHRRAEHLRKACDILLRYKAPDTLCGLAHNIGREGEHTEMMTLLELREAQTDMFTTVFVGNAQTMRVAGRMVTPRGYRLD